MLERDETKKNNNLLTPYMPTKKEIKKLYYLVYHTDPQSAVTPNMPVYVYQQNFFRNKF